MTDQVWHARIFQVRDGKYELVSEFVCADRSRANFLAGQAVDEMADFTGLQYEYGVMPVAVKL